MTKCLTCGREFEEDYAGRKYCSRSCAAKKNNDGRVRSKLSCEKTKASLKKYWSSKRGKERKSKKKKCPFCKKMYEYNDKRQKYCSRSCASKANGAPKISSSTHKEVVKRAMEYWMKHPEKRMDIAKRSQKGKHKNPRHILELSKRTVVKILSRLDIGCSNCGWNEDVCDLHHIVPRNKGGNDGHLNLSYLCPNCHRLAHHGKLIEIKNFQDYVGDRWKDFYYG
jgi:hypothetical protein